MQTEIDFASRRGICSSIHCFFLTLVYLTIDKTLFFLGEAQHRKSGKNPNGKEKQ